MAVELQMRIIYIRSNPTPMAVQILNDMPDAAIHRGDRSDVPRASSARAPRLSGGRIHRSRIHVASRWWGS